MPQILYLNSVRFPFSVPSEDCSCKIHGLRVGITQASRGWTHQVRTPLNPTPLFLLSSPPCSLPPNGGVYWETWRVKLIYMCALQEYWARANASLSQGVDTRGGEPRSPQSDTFMNHP